MDIDAIKCPQCKEVLKIPVILPCGHTICKQHVDKAIENNETNIRCIICDKFIVIPPDGFVGNRVLENLLEREKKKKTGFGECYRENFRDYYEWTIETCKSFEELLEELNRVKNDPEMKINTVINEFRNKVDLKREEMKQEIDRNSLILIERIDEFEKECKVNASNVKSDWTLDAKLEKLRNDLDETKKSSVTVEIFEKWMKIADESKSAIKEIQSELFKFNESLFLNRLNSFDCINLSVLKVYFPIRMIVKDLSKYKDSIEPEGTDIAKNTVKAYGLEWILSVRIQQEKGSNEDENYFGIYLGAFQNPRIQNVKVDFEFEILDQFRRGNDYKKKRNYFSILFSSAINYGTRNFISLKELMNNYNLYNIEDDSCTVQVLIKQIEWV